MKIRLATKEDITAADEIYRNAKEYMKKNGNPDQWRGDYPSGLDVELGIPSGVSYVIEDAGEIVATFHFEIGHEPTYDRIYEGEWKNDAPYAFIHRIAVKYHGRGIVDFVFSECFKMRQNLKIDTHRDNLPMQRVLLRNGFRKCGVIYLESGDERVAYQKTS